MIWGIKNGKIILLVGVIMPEDIPKQKTYSQMRAEFYRMFKEKIEPQLEKYEKPRMIVVVVVMILYVLMFVLGFYLSYEWFVSDFVGFEGFVVKTLKYLVFLITPIEAGDDAVFPIMCFLTLTLPFCLARYCKSKFEKEVKQAMMRKIVPILGDLKWSSSITIPSYEARSLCIFPNFVRNNADDYFAGCHNGVDFEIFNPNLEDKRRSKNRTYYVTVFDGVIVKFKLNKNFSGHTIIVNNSLFHMSPASSLRHTELEDVQFEKKYDVYTTDEVEARYLITTAFIDRLNNLKTKFLAKNIECAFKDEYLYVAFEKKDAFGICNIYKPIADFEQFNSMFEQILAVRRLIDVFKLEQKIGM